MAKHPKIAVNKWLQIEPHELTSELVLFWRSLPARSTRLSLPTRTRFSRGPFMSLISTVMMNMAWERELRSFMSVALQQNQSVYHSGKTNIYVPALFEEMLEVSQFCGRTIRLLFAFNFTKQLNLKSQSYSYQDFVWKCYLWKMAIVLDSC